MATAIHIEIDVLFFLILFVIAHQSVKNVSQQMSRVLFRWTVYGIMCNLALDTLWMLIDGKLFPGAVFLNKLVNAAILGSGIVIAGLWYLYVLETLGYEITRKLGLLVLSPGIALTALNFISMKTGWTFGITENNEYIRGPYFGIQMFVAIATLLVSFFHIFFRLLNTGNHRTPKREVAKLIQFYVIPVVGTLLSVPFAGMPGTWTCAAVSIILIYLDSQDEEIVRDSLTGLNNRKMLGNVFADYQRQETNESRLYLFMMDLDDFKKINDTLGHPVGDQALAAASKLFLQSVDGRKAMVARVGGDEFLILGFFREDAEADAFIRNLMDSFEQYNQREQPPYHFMISAGYAAHQPGQSLDEFIAAADEKLYQMKRKKKLKR